MEKTYAQVLQMKAAVEHLTDLFELGSEPQDVRKYVEATLHDAVNHL